MFSKTRNYIRKYRMGFYAKKSCKFFEMPYFYARRKEIISYGFLNMRKSKFFFIWRRNFIEIVFRKVIHCFKNK